MFIVVRETTHLTAHTRCGMPTRSDKRSSVDKVLFPICFALACCARSLYALALQASVPPVAKLPSAEPDILTVSMVRTNVKVKQSPYRPGVAQTVPGS